MNWKRMLLAVSVGAPLCFAPAALASQKAKTAKADAAKGETLYNRQCAMCHGKDGSGNTAMGKRFKLRDLKSEEVQEMTDAQLFDIIGKGKKGPNGTMPAYENNLGHNGIEDVVAYMRQMAKNSKK